MNDQLVANGAVEEAKLETPVQATGPELVPTKYDKVPAWSIYVELRTRISCVPYTHDCDHYEALDSL